MPEADSPCTLTEDHRHEIAELVSALDRRLGQLADDWDDQLAAHPGDVAAEERLDALIRWRDQLKTACAIPEIITQQTAETGA
jgi:hypothetical protein